MEAYIFNATGHAGSNSERDNFLHFSYEKEGKYYMGSISDNGEFRGILENFDPNEPKTLDQLKDATLEDATKLCGYWLASPLVISDITPSGKKPGTFHPRIWTPCVRYTSDGKSDVSDALVNLNQESFNQSLVSLSSLIRRLKEVFITIEPSNQNNHSYGHEIRNLLLLGSMEVEASLKGILKANGCNKTQHSTADYVKLKDTLLLEAYSSSLEYYPQYGVITPFNGWDETRPTQSLAWYNAYNATKHDRESHFDQATLERAINSICAAKILLHAQFGDRKELLSNELGTIKINRTLPYLNTQRYLPLESGEWNAVNLPGI